MIYTKRKTNRGFMALISVIIISAILLLVATSLSSSSFYGGFNVLDSELKERSSALAEACIDTAILRLANNPSYNPTDEYISLGGDGCVIESITDSPKVINVRADYQDYVTKLEAEVDSGMSITRFEEK